MTLQEFWDKCNTFDWYFDFSDDHQVWKRGLAAQGRLKEAARESVEHQAIYDGFHDHYFSGDPWKTERKPKPERPE